MERSPRPRLGLVSSVAISSLFTRARAFGWEERSTLQRR
jgi:hypothetical protein